MQYISKGKNNISISPQITDSQPSSSTSTPFENNTLKVSSADVTEASLLVPSQMTRKVYIDDPILRKNPASPIVISTMTSTLETELSPQASGDLNTLSPCSQPISDVLKNPIRIALLESENESLKKELEVLKANNKRILDHSIESDMRLLNYTDDIFGCKTDNGKEIVSKQEVAKLSEELSQAKKTINRLEKEKVVNSKCEKCDILKEQVGKMIDTIRILEGINKINQPSKNCSISDNGLKIINSFEPLTHTPKDTQDNESFTIVEKRRRKSVKRKTTKKNSKIHESQIKYGIRDKKPTIKTNVHQKMSLAFQNISIVGDSHCRHISAKLSERVDPQTHVTGICKPGARLQDIVPSLTRTEDHCYVIIGGSNDVAAGETQSVYKHMENIIIECRSTSKVLVATLPYRHDLPHDDRINEEIVLVNCYIEELCNRYEGVNCLDFNTISRRYFTRHGMHLSAKGKNILTSILYEKLAVFMQPAAKNGTTSRQSPTSVNHQSLTSRDYETYADAVKRSPSNAWLQVNGPSPATADQLTVDEGVPANINDKVFLGMTIMSRGPQCDVRVGATEDRSQIQLPLT